MDVPFYRHETVFVSKHGEAWGAQRFMGDSPEDLFVLSAGSSAEDAIAKSKELWPDRAIIVEDTCMECGGSGEYDDGDGPQPCEVCDGSGMVEAEYHG
jgi:hypothetical protein